MAAPLVFVTFNGDCWDLPFVETRAAMLGISKIYQIGMENNSERIGMLPIQGRTFIHMEFFQWEIEILPEEMMAAASQRPHELARYSASDAVCTYFLYMNYVHPFLFVFSVTLFH